MSLEPPERFLDRYPHELSGGQLQRVSIARALCVQPKVLLADEPISMLDVSVRLGVLNLLRGLCDNERLAILYITHDIASARYIADEIIVMYAGQVVEHRAARRWSTRRPIPTPNCSSRRCPIRPTRSSGRRRHRGARPVDDRRAGLSVQPALPARRWTSVGRKSRPRSSSARVTRRSAGSTRSTEVAAELALPKRRRRGERRRHDALRIE